MEFDSSFDNLSDADQPLASEMLGVMKALENGLPSLAAVKALTAMENRLEQELCTPPGMISCYMRLDKDSYMKGKFALSEQPQFSIDPSADLYGCPEDVQEATLQEIRQIWSLVDCSVLLWMHASESGDLRRRETDVKAFKTSFVSACWLRCWGLWFCEKLHTRSKPAPDCKVDQWDMFSNFDKLNLALKASKPLQVYNDFNMNGEWPEL